MRYLFLDTSFLISMVEIGRDLIEVGKDYAKEELIPATSSFVVKELGFLSKKKDKIGKIAKLALEITSKFKIFEEYSNVSTDDSLIELCLNNNGILATSDLEMLKKALKKGLSVLYLRNERELVYIS